MMGDHDDEAIEEATTEDPAEVHPLLGRVYQEDSEPVFELPAPPPAPRQIPTESPADPATRGSYVGKMFCEQCGFVGDHAPDCPALEAEAWLAAHDEADDEADDDDDAIIPLARRLVGAVFRKIARTIEGKR